MITIKDIAKNLIAKHQVSGSDAELFVQQMVEVINEGLLRDRQVKIKGFGTFKLQTVKERASINVNTGERVTISEHDKVTFTPDNAMRDLINKPFAQFDTVIVADDSPLLDESFEVATDEEEDDSEEEIETLAPTVVTEEIVKTTEEVEKTAPIKVEEPVKTEETVKIEAPVKTDDAVKAEETVKEEEPIKVESIQEQPVQDEPVEEKAAEEEPLKDNATDTDSVEEDSEEEYEEQETCSRQYPHCRNIFIYYGIIINIVVALIAFAIGYLVGNNYDILPQENTPVATPPAKPANPVAQKPAQKPVKPVADTAKTTKKDTIKPAEKATPTPLHQFDKDARVRTGAYYIMGTQEIVTVKNETTLKDVSKHYLGPGLECYTEAYNDYKEIKKGDKVKIPALKLKKIKKKHTPKTDTI